ncbi:SRPBCC family protein [Streptomyces sp. SP17KL33]|uniref:SRPBCC family protein n=1 Tax=Streptomyces sp. SP17KL33 TaxID=3002534 RepID=UPI002E786160|nr:SRPBCC family protein [Streptomyces sp. SP17KL33]MEE1836183.1 SRPBCC family protein [Streptomyces sp. SP17KL33]
MPIDLPTVFRPVAPFPGISGVKNQTEAWDHVGPRRNPQFDDGSQADEELTEYVPDSSFAYQLTGFTNVLSRLAAGVRGEFNVNPDGTLIRWTYEFKPLPGRRWILAGPFPPLWRRYMVAALDGASTSSKQRKTVSRRRSGPGDGPNRRGSSPRTSPPDRSLAST